MPLIQQTCLFCLETPSRIRFKTRERGYILFFKAKYFIAFRDFFACYDIYL